jgi:hypothetical protein
MISARLRKRKKEREKEREKDELAIVFSFFNSIN